jgi:hypothetical protein
MRSRLRYVAETTGMTGPAASIRRRRRGRRRAGQAAGIIVAASVLIYGAVMIGLGISGLHHENSLATTRGVSATALVSATQCYGRDTIQVIYQAGNSTVQGTVNVGDRRYRTGQPVLVIYDPEHPGVVGLAGDIGDKSSAWAEIVIGGLFVSLIPLSVLLSVRTARRRHRRAVRAVLGD